MRSPAYDGAIGPILDSLGVASLEEWKASGTDGLVVLRSTVMDPFLAAESAASDHIGGLLGALRRAGAAALAPEEGFTRRS